MNLTQWMTMFGLATALAAPAPARACGCLAPPDPTVPVVQAGERLVFSVDDGQVTAHIQIKYQGDAQDFGWLLPLPSVPQLELGTDELFTQLINATQPKYRMKRVYDGSCRNVPFQFQGRGAGPVPQNTAGGADDKSEDPSPVVVQSTTGPYDWAVLKADSKQEMLDWLARNHYFVPVGTDDVVAPYIHPGAYFLALKLHPGATVGDLTPVVVHYASDLAMIPIVLSSVAAAPDMGIQVWMLGASRAIPRNYYHTVIDDAAIDWSSAGQNYNDVIIRATKEAPGRHTFVTEYAGASDPLKKVLNYDGRFGDPSVLAGLHDPAQYVQYMLQHGFPLSPSVVNILERYVPFPSGIAATGVTAPQYYSNLGWWLGPYRKEHPAVFARYRFRDDPAALTDELFARVAKPTLAAGALFDAHPYLTRLYTTLSPEDMTRDPVFSFNPDLPSVSNVHEATLTYECGTFGTDVNQAYSWLRTEQGFAYAYDANSTVKPNVPAHVKASLRVEVLRESGAPEVQMDNTRDISGSLGGGAGCAARPGDLRRGGGVTLALLVVGLLGLAARRRSRG